MYPDDTFTKEPGAASLPDSVLQTMAAIYFDFCDRAPNGKCSALSIPQILLPFDAGLSEDAGMVNVICI